MTLFVMQFLPVVSTSELKQRTQLDLARELHCSFILL